jgi:broad specificity phosphatase PhoE
VRLLLIRHGQTRANIAGALDTAPPGATLTDLGHVQARALVDALDDEPIAAVYASPLLRAQLTAAPLASARGLDVRVQEGLEEIRAGDLEMREDEDSVASYLGSFTAWMHGDLARSLPGMADGHAFLARYDGALRAIADRHASTETVVAISHGAAIRTYTGLRTSADPHDVSERRIQNTGAVTLEGHPDHGWDLQAWSSDPLGGADLVDRSAHDVTGDTLDDVMPEDR